MRIAIEGAFFHRRAALLPTEAMQKCNVYLLAVIVHLSMHMCPLLALVRQNEAVLRKFKAVLLACDYHAI